MERIYTKDPELRSDSVTECIASLFQTKGTLLFKLQVLFYNNMFTENNEWEPH